MTLAAGTRLGPYEILSPLGAGGMGELYRALDARPCLRCVALESESAFGILENEKRPESDFAPVSGRSLRIRQY
jgi:hypothetical protein